MLFAVVITRSVISLKRFISVRICVNLCRTIIFPVFIVHGICIIIPAAVLVKGGHSVSDATDLLLADGKVFTFAGKRIDNPNTHGTGCTLSSAIACGLADGLSVSDSIERAKDYLTGVIAAGLDLGKGSGPVDHLYRIKG